MGLKMQKMGSNRKNTGERRKPSSGLGLGTGWGSLSPPQTTSRLVHGDVFLFFLPVQSLVPSYTCVSCGVRRIGLHGLVRAALPAKIAPKLPHK